MVPPPSRVPTSKFRRSKHQTMQRNQITNRTNKLPNFFCVILLSFPFHFYVQDATYVRRILKGNMKAIESKRTRPRIWSKFLSNVRYLHWLFQICMNKWFSLTYLVMAIVYKHYRLFMKTKRCQIEELKDGISSCSFQAGCVVHATHKSRPNHNTSSVCLVWVLKYVNWRICHILFSIKTYGLRMINDPTCTISCRVCFVPHVTICFFWVLTYLAQYLVVFASCPMSQYAFSILGRDIPQVSPI